MFVQVVYEHMRDVWDEHMRDVWDEHMRDVWDEHCWHLQAGDLQPMALVLYLALTANNIDFDDVPPSVYRDVLNTLYLGPNYDMRGRADVPHPHNGVAALAALADIRERSRNHAFRNPATSEATNPYWNETMEILAQSPVYCIIIP